MRGNRCPVFLGQKGREEGREGGREGGKARTRRCRFEYP